MYITDDRDQAGKGSTGVIIIIIHDKLSALLGNSSCIEECQIDQSSKNKYEYRKIW
jgi:hypothetical protein